MCVHSDGPPEGSTPRGLGALSRRSGARYALSAVLAALASLIPGKAQAGYGACSKCNCPQYEGNQNQCGNCGHAYAAHW